MPPSSHGSLALKYHQKNIWPGYRWRTQTSSMYSKSKNYIAPAQLPKPSKYLHQIPESNHFSLSFNSFDNSLTNTAPRASLPSTALTETHTRHGHPRIAKSLGWTMWISYPSTSLRLVSSYGVIMRLCNRSMREVHLRTGSGSMLIRLLHSCKPIEKWALFHAAFFNYGQVVLLVLAVLLGMKVGEITDWQTISVKEFLEDQFNSFATLWAV